MSDYIRVAAWAEDYVQAMRNQSLFRRLLFRLSMGKHAYREFIGMMDALSLAGMMPYMLDYSLQKMDYHGDEVPIVAWWREREPIEVKHAS